MDGTVFLYQTVEEAKRHDRKGATGFLIGKKVDGADQHIQYLVSNRHVVYEGGACVIRVNRRDGGEPDIFETQPEEWIAHPNGDDVAITYINRFIDNIVHRVRFLLLEDLLTQDGLREFDLGVGDEVVMIGRFVNYQGHREDQPAARFGSISVSLSQIRHPLYKTPQEGFAVEMRSRSGFSGSAVLVYWNPNTTLRERKTKTPLGARLLGVNWGYVLDEDGENTYLNGVVPAWKILDIMETPHMKKQHKILEEVVQKRSHGESGE